ncbi:PREDICTED: myb family transcription factor PHL5-like isoform X2 [Lupinus angustifolius]|uniref:myb family transcription factor PHL5-like isoform X2 n=1 Tax=Lupinus angustifolius TaxID=3871 RepID=UPI00092F6C04|nr:PREDICTED: myb family transcription factor PHL5-like isoform X2 [Lupinus angustifolius]
MYQYSSLMGIQWEHFAKVVGSDQLSFEPIKSPINIVDNPLQTPPSFCSSIDVPNWCFEFPKTTNTYSSMMFSQQACGDNFTNFTIKDTPSSEFTRSSLHSVAESFMSCSADSECSSEKNGNFASDAEKYSNFQPDNIAFYEHFSQERDKLVRGDAAKDERGLEISFQRNQPEKQSPQPRGLTCVTSSNNSASKRTPNGKRRIRWTKDLHEPFMMIVNRLGGPEKAKPKAILEEMIKSDNLLSISHVKSHLQKCRTTINMHKAMQERSGEGQITDGVTDLQVKIHMQIEESRKLQLEVRRSIHQQLEMQRHLQVLIQQQRKQLKIMLDNQKEGTKLEKILGTELDGNDSQ